MRKISILIVLLLSAQAFAIVDISCRQKEEILKKKRSQAAGWIWFVGEGMAFTQEDAYFKAEGQSLERLKSECGYIHKKSKFHERCIDKVGDRHHSYVRVSILSSDCKRSNNENRNAYLENKLAEYKKKYVGTYQKKIEKCTSRDLETCFQLAVKAYDNGQIQESLKLFKTSCEQGLKKSCINLGPLYYYEGQVDLALQYMTQACSKQSAQTCHLSSLIYFDRGNIKEGRSFASKACSFGELKSCYNLARTEISKKRQTEALKRNCKQRHGLSCHELGIEYSDKENYKSALNYFLKACEKSYILKSCYNAASIYQTIYSNRKRAIELYDSACSLGHSQSCHKN